MGQTECLGLVLSERVHDTFSLDDLWAPDAQLRLAGVLPRNREYPLAERYLRAAILSENMSVVPTAYMWLGDLMLERSRPDDAEESYRRALGGPDPAQRAAAGTKLGNPLAQRRDFSGAEQVFTFALEGDGPWTVEAAMGLLGLARRRRDRARDIERRLDALADTGSRTALELGRRLMHENDLDYAERILGLTASSDGAWAPNASVELGELLNRLGRPTEAWDALARAAGSGDESVAPGARARLVQLLRDGIMSANGHADAAMEMARRLGEPIRSELAAALKTAGAATQAEQVGTEVSTSR